MMQNFIYKVLRFKFFTYKFDLLEEIKCFCLLTKCKLAFWCSHKYSTFRTYNIYIYSCFCQIYAKNLIKFLYLLFRFIIYYLFLDEIVVHADLISPFMQLCTFTFPSSSNRGNLAHFLLCKDYYYH